MGRKALSKDRALDPEIREDWMRQLTPYFLQKGIRRINMQDIARELGVSKATVYQHFRSRDEMLEQVVDIVLNQIREQKKVLHEESISYEERFVHVFGLALRQVFSLSTVFLEDIKFYYPDLWGQIQDFYTEWEDDLFNFFSRAVDDGAFSNVHPAITSRMTITLIREMITPEFLIKNDVTVRQVLLDFFRLYTYGIFSGSKVNTEFLENKLQEILSDVLVRPENMFTMSVH